MAEQNKQALTERPNKVLDTIIRTTTARARRQISDWTNALRSAENVERPNRSRLYGIYNDILIDAHLTAEMLKRMNSLLESDFDLMDEKGVPNPEATAMLNKAWFTKLLQYAWESRMWGHSLVEITDLTAEGRIGDVQLVNRWHVVPEKGIVIKNVGDETGVTYRDNPKYTPWLFEIGDNYDLGLLNKTVPHVLYKRFAQASWSEFTEIFGIPPRYVKTPSRDQEHLNKLEIMLRDMGTSTYGVFGTDEEFDFMDVPSSDGSLYKNLIGLAANEISKLLNGSVIGEQSQEGSRAKEQVGMDLSQQIWNGDKTWMERIINEEWLPKMIEMGYPFANLHFEFNREKDLKAEWEIVSGVLNHFTVDPEYIQDTFGIPVIEQKMNGVNPIEDSSAKALGSSSFFD